MMKFSHTFTTGMVGLFLTFSSMLATATAPIFKHKSVATLWVALPTDIQSALLDGTSDLFGDLHNQEEFNNFKKDLSEEDARKVIPGYDSLDEGNQRRLKSAYLKIAKKATEIFIIKSSENLGIKFFGEKFKQVSLDYEITDEQLKQMQTNFQDELEPDETQPRTMVTGIKKTLHRIRVILEYGKRAGYILRIAKETEHLSDPLDKVLNDALQASVLNGVVVKKNNVLLIGPPNTSKTTLLREFIKKIAQGEIAPLYANGYSLGVVDRGEILGYKGSVFKQVSRELVSDRRMKNGVDPDRKAMRMAVTTAGIELVVMDELTEDNIDIILKSSGIAKIATTHGIDIFDVLENQGELLGGVVTVTVSDETAYNTSGDPVNKTRLNLGRPVCPFETIIVILEPGKYLVVDNATDFINNNLHGKSADARIIYTDIDGNVKTDIVRYTNRVLIGKVGELKNGSDKNAKPVEGNEGGWSKSTASKAIK